MKLFLSCREAAFLVSRDLDRELPLIGQILLYSHLLHCRACRRYREQLATIGVLAARLAEHDNFRLPDEARARITAAMRAAENDEERCRLRG